MLLLVRLGIIVVLEVDFCVDIGLAVELDVFVDIEADFVRLPELLLDDANCITWPALVFCAVFAAIPDGGEATVSRGLIASFDVTTEASVPEVP